MQRSSKTLFLVMNMMDTYYSQIKATGWGVCQHIWLTSSHLRGESFFVQLWHSSWDWHWAVIDNVEERWKSVMPCSPPPPPLPPSHTVPLALSLLLHLPLAPLQWVPAGSWPRLLESQHVFTTLWMRATLRALPAIWMLCNINNWCSWGVVIKLVNYVSKITCNYETGGYV